jgi:ribosomal protein L27
MGRPLAKDVLGTSAIGDFTGAKTGTRVEIYDTALRTDGVIIKQRGAKTFKCTRVGDIEDPDTYAKYILKNGTPSANGEMRLFGYVNTNSGDEINIAKITKRVATDFNDNKYNWILEDDSSNDYIVLTPLA